MRQGEAEAEAEAGEEECSLARFLLSSDYVVELGSKLMSTTDYRLKTATDSPLLQKIEPLRRRFPLSSAVPVFVSSLCADLSGFVKLSE